MMRGLGARARSLWRGIRLRASVEAGMSKAFRTHLELREADLLPASGNGRDVGPRARGS